MENFKFLRFDPFNSKDAPNPGATFSIPLDTGFSRGLWCFNLSGYLRLSNFTKKVYNPWRCGLIRDELG
jgi:hypothetical protein